MSFVLNGTTIPTTYNILLNSSPVYTLKVGTTTVWQKAAPQPTIEIIPETDRLIILYTNSFGEAVTLYRYAGASSTPTYTSETLAANSTKAVVITNSQITGGTTVYAYAYAVWNGLTSTTTSTNATMPTGAVTQQTNYSYTLSGSYLVDNTGNYSNGSVQTGYILIPVTNIPNNIVINFVFNDTQGSASNICLPLYATGYGTYTSTYYHYASNNIYTCQYVVTSSYVQVTNLKRNTTVLYFTNILVVAIMGNSSTSMAGCLGAYGETTSASSIFVDTLTPINATKAIITAITGSGSNCGTLTKTITTMYIGQVGFFGRSATYIAKNDSTTSGKWAFTSSDYPTKFYVTVQP